MDDGGENDSELLFKNVCPMCLCMFHLVENNKIYRCPSCRFVRYHNETRKQALIRTLNFFLRRYYERKQKS